MQKRSCRPISAPTSCVCVGDGLESAPLSHLSSQPTSTPSNWQTQSTFFFGVLNWPAFWDLVLRETQLDEELQHANVSCQPYPHQPLKPTSAIGVMNPDAGKGCKGCSKTDLPTSREINPPTHSSERKREVAPPAPLGNGCGGCLFLYISDENACVCRVLLLEPPQKAPACY